MKSEKLWNLFVLENYEDTNLIANDNWPITLKPHNHDHLIFQKLTIKLVWKKS